MSKRSVPIGGGTLAILSVCNISSRDVHLRTKGIVPLITFTILIVREM